MMNKEEAKKRIIKLRQEINHHRYLYHVLDKIEISDGALDSLKNELDQLERKYPDLITPDSPTQRVGGEALKEFIKVHHSIPMLSLNDSFSETELRAWEERILKLLPSGTKLEYYAEIKMDGLAVTLIYHDGILVKGATRGDGRTGEDVTQNLKTIEAIPLRLEIDRLPEDSRKAAERSIEVRGEVFMMKSVFEKLNVIQKKKGEPTFANPRNAAAGSIRQLDPKIATGRQLNFYAYDLITNLGQTTHAESHELFHKLGFKNNPENQFCRDLAEAIHFYHQIEKKRERLPYQMDGIVVNVNNIDIFKKLGVVGKAPRGAIAFKYPAEQATTLVEDIQVQVGRTGTLTPVAWLKPVRVAGSTISRATLHNEDEIERLDVRIGDTVIVQKAGDVIPDIVKVLVNLRTGKEKKFNFPKKCPVCGSNVIRRSNEAAHYCTNPKCFAQSRERLYHFVSRPAFDIDGLGPRIIDQLLEQELIRDPADLFVLKAEDLEPLEGFAEKAARNLIMAIDNSRKITLPRFIYALGIRHVGEETAVDIANNFGNIKKIERANPETLTQVHDVGTVVAESIYDFFHQPENLRLIEKLLGNGVKIINPQQHSQKLKGRTLVLTGGLKTLTREDAKTRIRESGGEISGSVSSKTDYVVVGENPGSKIEKAKKLNIKIISEVELLDLLK